MTLFDIRKRRPRCELAWGDEEVTGKSLMKVYHGFKQITVDCNILRALHALGLEFDTGNESNKLPFKKEKLR
jgi:hypothetical protein